MPRFLKGQSKNLKRKRSLRSEMTRSEGLFGSQVRGKKFENLKFRRQHGIGPYIVDFYCAQKALVIEIDGDVHACEIQISKDKRREEYLKSLGLQVIRYCNNDILNFLDDVLEDLWNQLKAGSTSPLSPPYKGGELDR